MRIDRLLILLDHMEQGRPGGHRTFNFSCFNEDLRGSIQRNKCGTSGCMAGELPIIWPEYFEFDYDFIRLKMPPDNRLSSRQSIMDFFDLDSQATDHLFYPEKQNPFIYGGKILGQAATDEQVTDNLRIFIKTMIHFGHKI